MGPVLLSSNAMQCMDDLSSGSLIVWCRVRHIDLFFSCVNMSYYSCETMKERRLQSSSMHFFT